jgi:hypothetical protein
MTQVEPPVRARGEPEDGAGHGPTPSGTAGR